MYIGENAVKKLSGPLAIQCHLSRWCCDTAHNSKSYIASKNHSSE